MSDASRNTHIHIEARTGLLNVDLQEIWRYRDLILLFTKRSFALTYKQTILGPAWILLNPFITSVIYTIVFGGIAGISTGVIPQILFYMGNNAVWSFFAACLTRTSSTFTANAGVFGKVYFPRLTVPVSTVLSAGITFFIQFLMLSFFWVYFLMRGDIRPHWGLLPLILPILLQLGCLGLGTGIIVSSLTTKYRDLSFLVGFGVQLWMYGTPVVYPMGQIESPLLRNVVHVNPVTQAVETFRYIFMGTGEVSLFWWMVSIVMTLCILVLGVLLFNQVEKTFMDTV